MTALVVYLQNTLARLRERAGGGPDHGRGCAHSCSAASPPSVITASLILGPGGSRPLSSRPAGEFSNLPSSLQLGVKSRRRLDPGLRSGSGRRRPTFMRGQQLRVLSAAGNMPMMSRRGQTIRSLSIMWRKLREGERAVRTNEPTRVSAPRVCDILTRRSRRPGSDSSRNACGVQARDGRDEPNTQIVHGPLRGRENNFARPAVGERT